MRLRRRPAGEVGLALLEVLIAGIVLGVAAIGVALLLNWGRTFIVAQGDDRVALYLAAQVLEQQIALGFPTVFGDQTPPTPSAGLGGTQPFSTSICVNIVNDDDPTSPSDCSPCGAGGSCTGNTARITVTVTPALAQAEPVTLQTVVVKP
jgi:hypothetical protein